MMSHWVTAEHDVKLVDLPLPDVAEAYTMH